MGGSISLRGWQYPDESYITQVHKWLELAFIPGCFEEALKKSEGESKDRDPPPPQEDWAYLHEYTHEWYLSDGTICPLTSSKESEERRSKIELVNIAVPAAGPGYAEQCALQHLPEDVDLVIIDFSVNDYIDSHLLSHPERHAYERILRRLLSLSKQPAVILFEAFPRQTSFNEPLDKKLKPGSTLGQEKHQLIAGK